MPSAMARVYVSDLDGTLLDADARLTPFARDTLWRLLDAGAPIGVATARSIQSVAHILGDLPLDLPVVCMNGAFLSDLRTLRHVRVHAIAPAVAEDVARRGLSSGIPFTISTSGEDDRLYMPIASGYSPAVYEGMKWYEDDRAQVRDPRLRVVKDVTVGLAEPVTCINFIAPFGGGLERLEEELVEAHGDRATVHRFPNWYSPGWEWMSVHAAEARKCRGVRAMLEHGGMADRELVVFGDAGNDLTMFEAADHAVAVENAIPELRELADEVIESHTTDAVARYLARALGD